MAREPVSTRITPSAKEKLQDIGRRVPPDMYAHDGKPPGESEVLREIIHVALDDDGFQARVVSRLIQARQA